MSIEIKGISHLLLDIEGTTCPVSFVAETLFPYASQHLAGYLQAHHEDPVVRELVAEVIRHWQGDADPEAQSLLSRAITAGRLPLNPAVPACPGPGRPDSSTPASDERGAGGETTGQHASEPASPSDVVEEGRSAGLHHQAPMATVNGANAAIAVVPYLQWLIQQDRKVTPLKELQGAIWEEGYDSGMLRGPLFKDVEPALRRWHEQGLVLAVYSSGSVKAQRLLYRHSDSGDLSGLFRHWFDTRAGLKQLPESYRGISEAMGVAAAHVLFISDARAELDAAAAAGMAAVCSVRPGNPHQDPGPHMAIGSFSELRLS